MCGIWGRISGQASLDVADVLGPIRKLAHRGPDNYAWYLSDDRRAALVHMRLSIIDLEGGAQPLESFDGRYLGVVNGELYDYDQHRDALLEAGVKFRTRSDSEVLLNLFAKHGPAGLADVSGEFAYVFYDRRTHRFHFGRDLHGVKPLFYRLAGSTLTLSSEVKALQDSAPEIDETYLKQYLCRIVAPPRTAVKDAFHVWPGRVFTFDPTNAVLESMLVQRLPREAKAVLTREESIERVHYEFSEAVRRRMVADVDVGTYLSGGVDSALVAAMMVHHGGKPRAFTVGFSEAELDESERAAAIAKHLGIRHEVIRLGASNIMSYLERSIVAFENPVANTHGAAKNLLAELASSQVKVVLSGEGADEWFGGYPYLRIRKLKDFSLRHPGLSHALPGAMAEFLALERGIARGHLDGRRSELDELARASFGGILPAVVGRILRERVRKHVLGGTEEALIRGSLDLMAEHYREDFEGASLGQAGDSKSEMNLNTWLSLRTDLFHYILGNLGDRQEMSHSLEGRTPFLDIKVARAAAQTDPRVLIRGLKEKWVLKEFAARYLPPAQATQRKHAFFGPMRYLVMRQAREQIDAGILAAKRATPWLEWKHIEHLVFRKKFMIQEHSLRDLSMALRLILYSVGVIAERLNEPQLTRPRGFELPKRVEDILSRRYRPTTG